jgi:sulfur-oxidizing protein SoxZ
MAIPIKLRASGDSIKSLISHPSQNGLAKDKATGKYIPALFIKNITITVNGKNVVDGQWGGGIAKDPYINIKIKGMKSGDKVVLNVVDSSGDTGTAEATVS